MPTGQYWFFVRYWLGTGAKRRIEIDGVGLDSRIVERLPPIVESHPPGVFRRGRIAQKILQLERARVHPPNAGLAAADKPPGRFDGRIDVQTLGEPEPAVGSPAERVDHLMGVTGAEARKDHPPLVGVAVAIGIAQVNQLASKLADVDSAIAQCQAGRHEQSLGKAVELVGAAVAIGVFANQDVIVGRRSQESTADSSAHKVPTPGPARPRQTGSA